MSEPATEKRYETTALWPQTLNKWRKIAELDSDRPLVQTFDIHADRILRALGIDPDTLEALPSA